MSTPSTQAGDQKRPKSCQHSYRMPRKPDLKHTLNSYDFHALFDKESRKKILAKGQIKSE